MRVARIILLVLLLSAIASAFLYLGCSERGREFLQHPHLHERGLHFQRWVATHPWIAPLVFIGVYLVLSVLALPVWWIQVLAGWGFGLVMGVVWTQVGGTLGAALTVNLSHWLAGDLIKNRVESRRESLQKLNERLGHNGLMVVMLVRLCHIMPFGVSNYAFGLTRIRARSAAIGTLLGGIPAAALYVGIGAFGGHLHQLGRWRFMLILAAINVLVAAPLLVRYLRPQWTKRIGIE